MWGFHLDLYIIDGIAPEDDGTRTGQAVSARDSSAGFIAAATTAAVAIKHDVRESFCDSRFRQNGGWEIEFRDP